MVSCPPSPFVQALIKAGAPDGARLLYGWQPADVSGSLDLTVSIIDRQNLNPKPPA